MKMLTFWRQGIFSFFIESFKSRESLIVGNRSLDGSYDASRCHGIELKMNNFPFSLDSSKQVKKSVQVPWNLENFRGNNDFFKETLIFKSWNVRTGSASTMTKMAIKITNGVPWVPSNVGPALHSDGRLTDPMNDDWPDITALHLRHETGFWMPTNFSKKIQQKCFPLIS